MPSPRTAGYHWISKGGLARQSRMALWTLALETHTGRLYRCFLGWGQLLWVALSGLGIVLVLVTGVIWWKRLR